MKLIESVRPVRLLFGTAPACFEEIAEAAQLAFLTEATEAGTAYVIDFADLRDANQDNDLIKELYQIREGNEEFCQIRLECA